MMVKRIFIGLCFSSLLMIFLLRSDFALQFALQVDSLASQLFTDLDFLFFLGNILAMLLLFIGLKTGSTFLCSLSFINDYRYYIKKGSCPNLWDVCGYVIDYPGYFY